MTKAGRKAGYTWEEESIIKRSKARQRPCTVDGKTIYPSVLALIAALGNGRAGYKHPNFKYMEESNDKSA